MKGEKENLEVTMGKYREKYELQKESLKTYKENEEVLKASLKSEMKAKEEKEMKLKKGEEKLKKKERQLEEEQAAREKAEKEVIVVALLSPSHHQFQGEDLTKQCQQLQALSNSQAKALAKKEKAIQDSDAEIKDLRKLQETIFNLSKVRSGSSGSAA